MDDQCYNALKAMGCNEDIVNVFKEKGLNYSNLVLLKSFPDMIPNLLPNFLDQLKLRQGLESLEQKGGRQILSVTIPSSSSTTKDGSSSNSSSSTAASVCGEGSSESSSVIGPIEFAFEELNNILQPDNMVVNTDDIVDVVEGPPSKRPRTDLATNSDKSSNLDKRASRYILDLLHESVIGKAIVANHQEHSLDNCKRCKLADIVVNAEYKGDTNKTIDAARFRTLAQWIVECFPGEVEETYYVPSSTRGKGSSACGKLYDAYTNINKDLRKVNLRAINAGPSKEIRLTGAQALLPPAPPAGDVSIRRSLEFLHVCVEPWELVRENWEITFATRIHSMRDTNSEEYSGISDYISKYPALTQPGGHALLEHDFASLFPTAKDCIVTKWPDFTAKLKAEFAAAGIIDCGESDTELLYNFPRLFSVVPIKIPGKRPWRASRSEIQEGFLVHIKVVGDLEKKIEGIKKTVSSKGCLLAPFPLIVGEDLKNITSSYLILNERPVRVESPKRAVELAFKSYHALYCDYPLQSERCWIVLQKAIFSITEENESKAATVPEVLRLVSMLKC